MNKRRSPRPEEENRFPTGSFASSQFFAILSFNYSLRNLDSTNNTFNAK